MITKNKLLKQKCTGCFACYNICPVKAISMQIDKEGFYAPVIDKSKCTNCGLCSKVCIAKKSKVSTNNKPICFVAWSKNKKILSESSSGGIFSELANIILNKKGIVFGVEYQNSKAQHVWIDSKKDLYKLRQSKYLPSYVGDSYLKVVLFLNKSKDVLFSGTPCQIAALYSYLKLRKIKNLEKLKTCEVLCHGVPSLRVFEDYLNSKNIDKKTEFEFRNKRFGWKLFSISYFSKGVKKIIPYYIDSFMVGFMKNLFLKEACYDFKFAKIPRVADITLADYLGTQKSIYNFYGVSAILVNSRKGEEIFKLISKNIFYQKINLKSVSINNPRVENGKYSEDFLTKRTNFFKEYNDKGFNFVEKKYLKPTKDMYLNLIKKGVRFILKKLSL